MKKSRLLSLLLAAVMASLSLSACGGDTGDNTESSDAASSTESSAAEETSSEETQTTTGNGYAWEEDKDTPVTLSVYYPTPGSPWEKWGEDPTSKRITEMTGISFTAIAPVTADDQKLSLLIASNELPDLIIGHYSLAAWGDMINNQQLADMEALADQYAPKVKELISETAWEYARREDGHVYNMTSWVRRPEEQQWVVDNNVLIGTNQTVIQIRQDYYEEIGSPEITNAEEFMAACEQMYQNHPDHIAFYGGDSAFLSGPGPMTTHFGISSYYEDADGNVYPNYRDPKYLDMYKWMYQMASKGLLTKESFVDDSSVSTGKTKQGLPITYTWTVGETGKIPADNPDTSYYPLKPWDTYQQVRTNAGYMAFGVSANSSNQERVMDWIEFLNTEEGAEVTCWGIEGDAYGDVENGPHFHYVDGQPKFFSEFLATKIADWDGTTRASGLDCFRECMVNDVMGDQVAWDPNDELIGKMNEWYGDKVVYMDQYIFNIPSGSDEIVVKQKIDDLLKEYNVKMVFASSEEEVETLYNEFLTKCEEAGEEKLVALYTEQCKENKARLGIQ